MTTSVYNLISNLNQISDEDLVVLVDESVAERMKRGLMPKIHEPGYMSRVMHKSRENAKARNGKNYEMIRYRKRNKLTQKELSERLAIPQARVCDYELGAKRTPEWIMDYIRKEEADGTL